VRHNRYPSCFYHVQYTYRLVLNLRSSIWTKDSLLHRFLKHQQHKVITHTWLGVSPRGTSITLRLVRASQAHRLWSLTLNCVACSNKQLYASSIRYNGAKSNVGLWAEALSVYWLEWQWSNSCRWARKFKQLRSCFLQIKACVGLWRRIIRGCITLRYVLLPDSFSVWFLYFVESRRKRISKIQSNDGR
jgi:hypothetical protein